jgi:hypothetical protein
MMQKASGHAVMDARHRAAYFDRAEACSKLFREMLIKEGLGEWADKLCPEYGPAEDIGYVGDDLDEFQTPAGREASTFVSCRLKKKLGRVVPGHGRTRYTCSRWQWWF